MRLSARPLLIGLLVLGAVEGPAPLAAAIPHPDSFVYLHPGDVDSLDPDWEYDNVSYDPVAQIYETLLFFKDTSISKLEPLLAARVPSRADGGISADGLTYRFKLRKGVKFQDGSALTPEDVRYSLLRFMLTDRDGGPSILLLEPLLGVESTRDSKGKLRTELYARAAEAVKVEGDELVVRLPRPFPALLSILAGWGGVVPKAWAVQHGDWDGSEAAWPKFNNPMKGQSWLHAHANGTGPFKLAEWDPQAKQVVLERSANYWRGPAKLKRVVLRTVEEFSTRKLLLAGGDADGIFTEREFLPQLEGVPGVVLQDDLPRAGVTSTFFFSFKTNPAGNPNIGSGRLDGDGIPPDFFADADVRRAFAYAFDYEAYLRDGFRGKGSQARGAIPKGVLGYYKDGPVFRHDPAKAAELLKKARGGEVWAKGFRFSLTYQEGRQDHQLACQILKKNIEALNPKFQVQVRGVQWSTFLADQQERKLPLFDARWTMDYPDPHNCAFPFLHSRGLYAGVQGYKNTEVDALVEQAEHETRAAEREALYRRAQKLAYEDAVQIYTVDTPDVRAGRSWVQNWYYNPMLPTGYFYRVEKKEPKS